MKRNKACRKIFKIKQSGGKVEQSKQKLRYSNKNAKGRKNVIEHQQIEIKIKSKKD